jgi:phosphatidylglycerophosphatase A
MQNFCKKIVTLGHLGYLAGSGTWATACTLPVVWFISSSFTLSILLGIFFLGATVYSFPLFKEHDPSEIVADEIIGFTCAMFGIARLGWVYLLGFLLFRLLDITKTCGIHRVEKLPGVTGVVMDDVVAGLYTNLLLRLCLWLFL